MSILGTVLVTHNSKLPFLLTIFRQLWFLVWRGVQRFSGMSKLLKIWMRTNICGSILGTVLMNNNSKLPLCSPNSGIYVLLVWKVLLSTTTGVLLIKQ